MYTTRRSLLAFGIGGAAAWVAGRRLLGADTMTKLAAAASSTAPPASAAGTNGLPSFWEASGTDVTKKVERSEEEWQKLLTPEQYRVLRKEGTEMAFTGAYWNNHERGVYHCAGCGLEVWASQAKFESGTGWPSFWQPIAPNRIGTQRDFGLGMMRTEVHCARCEGHHGHVFDDGPEPTGLRYCMNSVALVFEKR